MINYYCPDFYTGTYIYTIFDKYKKLYPEIFYENTNIKYIFGSIPNMIWNGGTVLTKNYKIFYKQIEEIKNLYENLNIPLQLTLTNTSLKEEHLRDEYCNNILKIMDNKKNEVLVSTEMMYDYIKNNYPHYKINRSIVNTSKDYDWEKALDKKYHNIVMPRRNINFNYLSNIKKEYRNRIELLCNDPCPIDCPMINTHYKLYEELTLYQGPDLKNALICNNKKLINLPFNVDFSNQILYEDIIQTYYPLGYTEYKLSGRGKENNILSSIIPYLIKPKYQIIFFTKIMEKQL